MALRVRLHHDAFDPLAALAAWQRHLELELELERELEQELEQERELEQEQERELEQERVVMNNPMALEDKGAGE